MKRHRIVLSLLGLTLLVAMAACLMASVGRAPQVAWQPLGGRLPKEIDGWVGEDVPLGQNEVVEAAVGRLNYEDYIYRVYRRGGAEVFVYAMYWSQGRISVREMSGHTPDGCWVRNGARHCAPFERKQLTIEGRTTAMGESRSFEFPSAARPINVIWWHIWGGQLVDRGFARKTLMPMLREVWIWLAHRGGQQRDQILVRVHSELPINVVQETPPVQAFLKTIPVVFEASPIAGGG